MSSFDIDLQAKAEADREAAQVARRRALDEEAAKILLEKAAVAQAKIEAERKIAAMPAPEIKPKKKRVSKKEVCHILRMLS